jgi:class 3 adenylate cyclase
MDSDRLPRKLAAILYADVAGYSRLNRSITRSMSRFTDVGLSPQSYITRR